jgi:GT2 family glycosyltransferase
VTDWEQRLQEINYPGDSRVVIANLHPGDVSSSFQESMEDTFELDRGRLRQPDGRRAVMHSLCGAGQIVRGRNSCATAFLDGHPQADLLMFIDSDMGWDPDAVEFLAQTIDATGLPILGGLCFGARPLPAMPGQQRGHEIDVFPTLYAWNTHGQAAFDTKYDYPPDEIVEVAATGAAFIMIHRRVLEAIRADEGDEFFTPVTVEGHNKPFGEDMSFCLRARNLGYPTHVHTGVKTSHRKDMWVTERTYRDLRTPASSAVTVVIPVKDELNMTRDLVGQLVGQGGITDILLFDNGSHDPAMKAWLEEQTEASVYNADGASISEMWNAGITEALIRHRGLADVVFLNNDLNLSPRCIRRLVAGLRSQPQMMAACPNYDRRPGAGVSPLKSICANRYDGTGGLAGFAFALRSEWLATGFRFDENMAWWYSDNDLCLEIEKAGGWYGMVHDAQVVHLDGGSKTERPDWWDERVQKDREAFEAKWPQVTVVAA